MLDFSLLLGYHSPMSALPKAANFSVYPNCVFIEYSSPLAKRWIYESLIENRFTPDSMFLFKEEKGNSSGLVVVPFSVAYLMGVRTLSNNFKSANCSLNLKEKVSPFYWQRRAIEKIITEKKRNGLIKAPTGSGKTVFSLLLANRLGCPSLVVVDREVLIDQWVDKINEVFENPRVIVLDRKNVEDILENEYDFAVTTVQFLNSLMKKDFKKYFDVFDKSNFNMVIYDEAHTTSAAIAFGKSVALFGRFKYIFGVTATPYISNFPLHFYTIGSVIIDAEKLGYKNDLKDKLSIEVVKDSFIDRLKIWNGMDRTLLLAQYQTQLESSEKFRDRFVNLINKKLAEERRVLVVVSRLETIDYLAKIFPNAKILTSKRKDSLGENERLIIATYGVVSKGFDYPSLDTLITSVLIYGKVSSVQLVGRILRKTSNKKEPQAIFVVDKSMENILDVDIKKELEFKIDVYS